MEIAELEQICSALGEQHHLKAIGLFGSRARGEATAYSDYDIFIMGNIGLTEELMIEELLQREIGREVDVIRLTPNMDKILAKNILNEAILFYNKDETYQLFYEMIELFFRDNQDFIARRKRDLIDEY